jgi:hypothetical protein
MNLRFPFVLCACLMLAVGMARAQGAAAAQLGMDPGKILVTKPVGEVWVTAPGGVEQNISSHLYVDEKATVRTGINSSVILIFSNKAQTQLGPETTLRIDAYKDDRSFAPAKDGDDAVEDGRSETLVFLERGELTGQVKLRKDATKSSFQIRTPVGAAGIRGTTFRIVYIPAGPGQAFGTFRLTNANGAVEFLQNGQGAGTSGGTGGAGGTGGGTPGGTQGTGDGGQGQGTPSSGTPTGTPSITATGTVQGLAIPAGQQIEVIVVQNAQGQFVPQVPVSSNSAVPIPPALAQQITQVSTAIAQAVQQVVFPSSPPATGSAPGTTGGTTTPGTGTTESGSGGSTQTGSTQQTGTQSSSFTAQGGGATATGQVQTQTPPRIPTNAGPR